MKSDEMACKLFDVLVAEGRTMPILDAIAACVTLLTYVAHRAGCNAQEISTVVSTVMTKVPEQLGRMSKGGQA